MVTTGLLKDIEKKEEKITDQLTITQQDIRQIQMAKSAIRTGIDILLKESHLTAEAIKKVYITGGFGEYFNSNKAIAIGLLHEIFEGKIETCHNTSLQGSIQGLLDKEVLKGYHNLSDAVNYLELANHPDFESLYINYMNF